ncbi:MAG: endonuclease/exonuclease/phosphatase family protein [Clostridia bacterium]|nr:endonuclease/exonuclease/phosphatase family protein [Clostridia bacterium]
MNRTLKTIIKIVAVVLLAFIMLVAAYCAYVLLAFHRIGDRSLDASGSSSSTIYRNSEYTLVSFNMGFGAYEDDYGFFMDGGTQSWAWSKERLDTNLTNIASLLKEQNADIYFVQEVDTDSTRTYHVDERKYLTSALSGKAYVYAQNFDSPFLFYPFLQPHGISKSGIMTFSSFPVTSARRVELPIEEGLSKLVDLDRCYLKCRLEMSNNKYLVLYNFHLSAYTTDGTIANDQLKLIISDMETEYAAGNYCVAGGDFNKDILGDSSVYFGKSDKEYNWAKPIPEGMFDDTHISIVAPLDEDDPVPTCRNADSAYHDGQYVLSIDGFMVTDNVKVQSSAVIDTKFRYSDHNPVKLTFKL